MIDNSEYKPFIGSDRSKKVRKGLVDLIIPNAAGPAILSRLLNSLMQNMSYELEDSNGNKFGGLRIIVVSQGEHGSHNYLKEMKQRFPDTIFPVYKDVNFPPPIPYNDGLEYSARIMNPLSEYIMFLDDDMVVLKPGLIELEIKHLESNNFVNVATEHCYFGDKSKLGPNGESKDFGMGSFLFRRKLFEKVGYLDEYFKFHCSDTDYNRRIRMFYGENKIAVIPGSDEFMFHQHQQGTHNFFKGNHQHVIDNDWVMYAKKWHHDDYHGRDIVGHAGCPMCDEIRQKQLPLGRKVYLYGGN